MAKGYNRLEDESEKKKALEKAAAEALAAKAPAATKKRRKNATATEHLPGWVLDGWFQRAKRAKIPYDLTPEQLEGLWVAQNGLCAVTARPMNTMETDPSRVSLDRVDSTKGYTIDNVRLVCTRVNLARNKWSDDDLRALCQDMAYRDRLVEAREKWNGRGHWYSESLRPIWERVLGRKVIDPTKPRG